MYPMQLRRPKKHVNLTIASIFILASIMILSLPYLYKADDTST
jgi:uncharacterized membrane protein YadS